MKHESGYVSTDSAHVSPGTWLRFTDTKLFSPSWHLQFIIRNGECLLLAYLHFYHFWKVWDLVQLPILPILVSSRTNCLLRHGLNHANPQTRLLYQQTPVWNLRVTLKHFLMAQNTQMSTCIRLWISSRGRIPKDLSLAPNKSQGVSWFLSQAYQVIGDSKELRALKAAYRNFSNCLFKKKIVSELISLTPFLGN